MGLYFYRFLYRFKFGVSRGIQTLSQRFASKIRGFSKDSIGGFFFERYQRKVLNFKKYQKRFWGGFFFLTAVGLGVKANDISQMEALRKWQEGHPPSLRVVEYSLGTQSFHPVRDLQHLQKLMRFAPNSLDEMGSLWVNRRRSWVAYYGAKGGDVQIHLYCQDCSELPKDWEPLGIGWIAFERLMFELEGRSLELQKKRIQTKKKEVFRDPREIVY